MHLAVRRAIAAAILCLQLPVVSTFTQVPKPCQPCQACQNRASQRRLTRRSWAQSSASPPEEGPSSPKTVSTCILAEPARPPPAPRVTAAPRLAARNAPSSSLGSPAR